MSVEVTESIKEAETITATQQKITLPFSVQIQATSCKKWRDLTSRTRVGDFLVRVHRGTFAVLSTGIVLANAPFARAQDATSTNLPEQFETREAIPTIMNEITFLLIISRSGLRP